MQGWILYYKNKDELNEQDSGVNRLLQAAEKKGITLDVFRPEIFDLVLSPAVSQSIFIKGKEKTLPDFIIPRQGSQTSYWGLAVIRYLEAMGVYSCNAADTVEIVKDKWRMHQLLRQNGLPTPQTHLIQYPFTNLLSGNQLTFPLVIKSLSGTEGKGIYLIETENQLVDLLELLEVQGAREPLLLQKFIQSSYGQDLRVFVLGNQALACVKREAREGFKANFCRGGQVRAYPLTPRIEQLALETAALVNLEIGGIDILLDGEDFQICEANSAPGFKGLETVIGSTIAEQILDYIVRKVERQNWTQRELPIQEERTCAVL